MQKKNCSCENGFEIAGLHRIRIGFHVWRLNNNCFCCPWCLRYFKPCSLLVAKEFATSCHIYGVHLRTKIIENKRQFEVQKLDYPCRNLVIWIWNRNERSRNGIIRTWSYLEQVETIKGKLDIADVEVQITIPTKMQITWFELQFTFSTLISHLIVHTAISGHV